MAGFKETIDLVQDGELVRAAIANRAPRQLDGNIRFIRDLFEAALLGETVFARCRTVEVDAKVGQPVFFNAITQQFERAIGAVDVDEETGQFFTSASTQVWGIIHTKINSTKADILLFGVAKIDLGEAVDDDVEEGVLYFLSNSSPGKLVTQRPPVGVSVLLTSLKQSDGTTEIYVNTKLHDLLEAHKHFRFELQSVPAGTHVPPAEGEVHVITDPDPTIEGWLPADHPIFEGTAPEGAFFGYNLGVSKLDNLWPPLPAENSIIEISRPTNAAGDSLAVGLVTVPPEQVTINREGLWWNTNCFDEVPWPTDFGAEESVSESVSACPFPIAFALFVWFTKPLFQTTGSAVLSLIAKEGSGLVITCTDDGDPASVGHLTIDFNLDILQGGGDEPGHLVFKRLDGTTLLRGPVVASISAPGSNVTLVSDVEIGEDGKAVGNVIILVEDNIDATDLAVDTVRLDNVTEEFFQDTIALGFRTGIQAEYRGRIQVPSQTPFPTGTKMKLRIRVMTRIATDIPAEIFSLSVRRISKPPELNTAVALPLTDTTLGSIPTADITITEANQYADIESAEFEVEAGETIQFTLGRAGDTDGYLGELHVLRQRGVLVAGG